MLRKLILLGALLAAAATSARADDSLYRALGGTDGIQALSTDFVVRLKADPRIGSFFKDISSKHLAKQLSDQFCQLAGGPCVYEGETMRNSHGSLGIVKADFHAAVEDLQAAMEARGVPFAEQNRLLALLAPMHRDIVSR